jgi:hypothetical protein
MLRANEARNEKIFWLCLGFFLMLISAVIIVVLTRQYYRVNELYLSGVKTDGVIYRVEAKIKSGARNRGSYESVAHVRYSADGRDYTSTLNYSTPNTRVGSKIDIYYDPKNPSRISGGAEVNLLLLFIGIMSVEFLVAFLAFRSGLRGLLAKR